MEAPARRRAQHPVESRSRTQSARLRILLQIILTDEINRRDPGGSRLRLSGRADLPHRFAAGPSITLRT